MPTQENQDLNIFTAVLIKLLLKFCIKKDFVIISDILNAFVLEVSGEN